jgi:SAM-dependent methyltransferase
MSEGRTRPCGYDEELRRHDAILRRAWDVQTSDHVLDIGCGLGQTTCEAARLASAGTALGVDISDAVTKRARELALARGVGNVRFECADAQVYRFSPASFDLAVSRFGVMFFRDPTTAFTNIARALRPGGRLVTMVWQDDERNEWAVAVRRALARPGESAAGTAAGREAFSLADPAAVADVLEIAGFTGITFTHVHEPVYYGPDVAAALNWTCGFASTRSTLEELDPSEADAAVQRLRATLASHAGDTGVWFDSRSWLVTARRC